MNTPLLGGDVAALLAAPALGFGFGFLLERAGLAHAPRLAAMFYGRDFTVLKVLFSAVVTAMLGGYWLDRFGLLDLRAVYVPETFLVPQLLGGAVFGIGFVLTGLCPGTACAAAATGRGEGALTIAGLLAGVLGYMLTYPVLRPVADATARGGLTLPEWLGLDSGMVMVAVVLLALAAFRVAERIERARA